MKNSADELKLPSLVHAMPDSAPFARRLAQILGVRFSLVRKHLFPDGETLVRVEHREGAQAVLVQCFENPDAKLMPLLLAADALRRRGASEVTLIAPYLAYMRQDKVFHPGEPVSQRVMAGCLRRSFDRVLTVEAHLHRTRRLSQVMGARSRSLSAAPAIARWLARRGRDIIVVGPDEESEPWIRSVARMAGLRWAVGVKRRSGDRRVNLRFPPLAPGAIDSIRRSGVRTVVSCDTVAHPTNRIGCAPLLAAALAGSDEA